MNDEDTQKLQQGIESFDELELEGVAERMRPEYRHDEQGVLEIGISRIIVAATRGSP